MEVLLHMHEEDVSGGEENDRTEVKQVFLTPMCDDRVIYPEIISTSVTSITNSARFPV